MAEIIIQANKTDGQVSIDCHDLNEEEICMLLLEGYQHKAKELIDNHKCNDPECKVVDNTKQITETLEKLLKEQADAFEIKLN